MSDSTRSFLTSKWGLGLTEKKMEGEFLNISFKFKQKKSIELKDHMFIFNLELTKKCKKEIWLLLLQILHITYVQFSDLPPSKHLR